MAKDILPVAQPSIPTTLSVPQPGDGVQASKLETIFQNLLNGLWAVKALAEQQGTDAGAILSKLRTVDGAGSLLDADLLDGISAEGFWKKTDTLPASGSTDATTLQGNGPGAFLAYNGKAQNAAHADYADSAANAGHAGNADAAAFASDSAALGGKPASDFNFAGRLTFLSWTLVGPSFQNYPSAPTVALGQHASAGWALGALSEFGNFRLTHNMGNKPLSVTLSGTGGILAFFTVNNGGWIDISQLSVRGDGTTNGSATTFNAVVEPVRVATLALIIIDLS